jgi:pilus assembly protein Flp/PilA
MVKALTRFIRDESGGTAIEYGLICALVVIGAMVSLVLFADEIVAMIDYVSSEFEGASQGASP